MPANLATVRRGRPCSASGTIPSRCAVWIASGARYLREAEASCESFRALHPKIDTLLITDSVTGASSSFGRTIIRDDEQKGKRFKLRFHQVPAEYEQVLFLDTDTLVFGSLDPGFECLEHFDLAAVQATGYHYQVEHLPCAFPEFNSGVVFFRNSERVREVLRRWPELYERTLAESGQKWDQRSFRELLYFCDLRLATLPV